MNRPRADLTEAELDVLKALWKLGPSSIRDLTEEVYPGGGVSHHATVQKLLERLAAKRCVARRRSERLYVYEARVNRLAVIEHRLRDTAEALCDGSLTPLLTHLVGSADLSQGELDALRALVMGRASRRPKR